MQKKYFWGLLLVLGIISIGGYTSLVIAQAPADSALLWQSTTNQEIILELSVSDFQVETVDRHGQTYQRFVIPDMVQTAAPGAPQVPTHGAMVGIPTLSGVSLEVLETDYEILDGYQLNPAPGLETINHLLETGVKPVFVLDETIYAANAFYPDSPVALGEIGHLRDQAVAQVQFYPVQYNPVTHEIRLYRRIVVRLTWNTLGVSDTVARGSSPAYETLLQNTLINYDDLERTAEVMPPSGLGPMADGLGTFAVSDTVKIGITEDGLYELTPADLAGTGFYTTALSTIKVKNKGTEIPIYVHDDNDNDTFDGNDYVLFYGTAITDIYTSKNVYWLEAGGSAGQRMNTRFGTTGGTPPDADFPATVHLEEDTYYWQTMPNGAGEDHWFWGNKLSPNTGGLDSSRDAVVSLKEYISVGATNVNVHVRLKGYTGASHQSRIYLNGTEIDHQTWSGQIVFDHSVTASHTLLTTGVNTVTVEAVNTGGVDQFFLNWVELDYYDVYTAENDALLFGVSSAGTSQFEITNFSTSTIQVFDVSDPTDVAVITDTAVTANGATYTLQFQDMAQADSRYLALTPGQRQAPGAANIAVDEPSSWKDVGNGADYIIITHEDFYANVQSLATHRGSAAAGNYRVATVKVQDIYDEFNDGIFNPLAIRDFLTYAYNNWVTPAPTYVVLVGDAYLDYKDGLNKGTTNYVPSQVIETDTLGQTVSDNWFVLLDGDTLPDMLIGRLSAQNGSQVNDIVDKIIYYDQNPPDNTWNTEVLFVADDDESSFETTSDQLAARLPTYYTANKVYVDDYPPGDPTADISSFINSGSLLANYTGHGNVDEWGTWSGGDIFKSSDVSALSNDDKMVVLTVANCLNGYFASSTSTSLAESFQRLNSRRGAVGVWAPTGLGYPSGHRALMTAFYDAIFQEDRYALGAATTQAKIKYATTWTELVDTFVLFGDPATQLGLPTNYPYVETVSPADGATDVALNEKVRVTFSKPMSATTVSLTSTVGHVFTPTWNSDYTMVDYDHPHFDFGETLTVTVSGQDNISNVLGTGPISTTWSFKTFAVEGTMVTIQPGVATTLVYTDTQGNPTIIFFPANAVAAETILVYNPVISTSITNYPSGWTYAEHAFNLRAFQDGQEIYDSPFDQAVSIMVYYSNADVDGLDEESLILGVEKPGFPFFVWEDAAVSCDPASTYNYHPDENWLSVSVCDLDVGNDYLYALFEANQNNVYIPIVLK